jgi:hypothetical protein
MPKLKYLAISALLAVAVGSLLGPVQAQQGGSVADLKSGAEAIQTLQAQQQTITDNQAKIDAKLATIAENVRVARLYAARIK